MPATRRSAGPAAGLGLLALLAAYIPPLAADDYLDARSALAAAYEREDYRAMRAAAGRALAARPGYPGALFNRALAEVLDGDADAALATLENLLERDLDFGVDVLPDFAALRTLPGWGRYAEGLERLRQPRGHAERVFALDDGGFLPEGIALDLKGGVYLGSVRTGRIAHVDPAGVRTVAPAGPHWGVYGMRLRGDTLWFVSSAVAAFTARSPGAAGRTGLFKLDMASGRVTRLVELPRSGEEQVLGDLEFVGQDTVWLADQAGGVIYRYAIGQQEPAAVVPQGVFRSPQGMALDAAGTHVYVADYVRGLFRVRIADAHLEPVADDGRASLYGIDGLYRYGDALIAIQNGVRPNRVVRLDLDARGLRVVSHRILAMNLPDFDEPNLGEVVGDDFYFIANSHWNRVDTDGGLPAGLSGPVVLRVRLQGAD